MTNLKLTEREVEALLYAIRLAEDSYAGTDSADIIPEVKQDMRAWDRITSKLGVN